MSKMSKLGALVGILLAAGALALVVGCNPPQPPPNFTLAPQLCGELGCQSTAATVSGQWQHDASGLTEYGNQHTISPTYINGSMGFPNGRAPAVWIFTEESGACSGASTTPSAVLYQETVNLACFEYTGVLGAFDITPDSINEYLPPASYTVTGGGMSSQYGMPVLQYYDSNGNLVAQTTGSSVSSDGTQMTGTTPSLSGVANGFYEGVISNAGPNGTYTPIGAVGETIYTPTPPAFNESVSLGSGQSLKWVATTTTGACGAEGSLTYTEWSDSYLTYVDSSGYLYPLSGGGVYISSPGTGEGCPPGGPQPSSETLGYTGANNNILIQWSPGYGGTGSAGITQQ